MQIAYDGKIIGTQHTPVQNWRAGKANEDGEITEMWYSDNWAKPREKRFKPEPYPVWNPDNPQALSVLPVRPYRSGSFYYPSVDYMGGLQYAHLEEEISNFHLNNIFNGLFPQLLVNFNQGDPGDTVRDEIEKKVMKKWGHNNTGRVIFSWNDSAENAATIEAPPLNDLDKMYEFLSTESMRKIMVAHRVTSPLLFGIRDSSGLGSNADEITNAYELFENTVIQPYRDLMLKSFEDILAFNGTAIPLTFESLQPIPEREQSPTQMASHKGNGKNHDHEHILDEATEQAWLGHLKGVGEWYDPDEWEEIESRPVTDGDADADDEAIERQMAELELDKMPTEGNSKPQNRSRHGDRGLYKIRYRYAPRRTQSNSREFCTQMVGFAKRGIVYRKEDIQQMGRSGVNGQFAPSGQSTYSIWLFKGGVNCHHYWERVLFRRKRDEQGRFKPRSKSKTLENEQPVTEAQAKSSGVEIPKIDPRVETRPIDMPNQGRKN